MFGLTRAPQRKTIGRIPPEILQYVRMEYGESAAEWYMNEIRRSRERREGRTGAAGGVR